MQNLSPFPKFLSRTYMVITIVSPSPLHWFPSRSCYVFGIYSIILMLFSTVKGNFLNTSFFVPQCLESERISKFSCGSYLHSCLFPIINYSQCVCRRVCSQIFGNECHFMGFRPHMAPIQFFLPPPPQKKRLESDF